MGRLRLNPQVPSRCSVAPELNVRFTKKYTLMKIWDEIRELAPLLQEANHIDVKTVVGTKSLEEFVAALLSFPKWAQFLFHTRKLVAKTLGLKHEAIPMLAFNPDNIPMNAGDPILFFIVKIAKKGHYWVVESQEDKHLNAYLGVIVEPINKQSKKFHVITVVHYKHWTGPVYFNLIRPFHHLLVYSLAKSAVRTKD